MIAPAGLLELITTSSQEGKSIKLVIDKGVFYEHLELIIEPNAVLTLEEATDDTPTLPPPTQSIKDVRMAVPLMELQNKDPVSLVEYQ